MNVRLNSLGCVGKWKKNSKFYCDKRFLVSIFDWKLLISERIFNSGYFSINEWSCCQWKFAKPEPSSWRRIDKESLSKKGTKLVSTPFLCVCFWCWNSKNVHRCIYYIMLCKKCVSITLQKMTQFNNFQVSSTNLSLTEREGARRTGEYIGPRST